MQRAQRYGDLPPVWMLGAMALMWWLAENVPILDWSGIAPLGWLVIAGAIVLTLLAALHFRRQRTPIIPRQEPTALVTTGPYRFSRNPIYLADALILTGWTLILGALSPIVMIPAFMLLIERRFIRPEEAVLRQHFGSAFDDYCHSTRRWL